MSVAATLCPACGEPPSVDDHGGFYVAVCSHCYDGAEDGTRISGMGATPKVAIKQWYFATTRSMLDELGDDVPCPECSLRPAAVDDCEDADGRRPRYPSVGPCSACNEAMP